MRSSPRAVGRYSKSIVSPGPAPSFARACHCATLSSRMSDWRARPVQRGLAARPLEELEFQGVLGAVSQGDRNQSARTLPSHVGLPGQHIPPGCIVILAAVTESTSRSQPAATTAASRMAGRRSDCVNGMCDLERPKVGEAPAPHESRVAAPISRVANCVRIGSRRFRASCHTTLKEPPTSRLKAGLDARP
jgi:hypothetical protein